MALFHYLADNHHALQNCMALLSKATSFMPALEFCRITKESANGDEEIQAHRFNKAVCECEISKDMQA